LEGTPEIVTLFLSVTKHAKGAKVIISSLKSLTYKNLSALGGLSGKLFFTA
jgi:hypothetical protein